MADVPSTISTLAGLHKEVYGNEADIDKVLPASAVLQDVIPFDTASKIGDSYHQAVHLSHSNGFTYNGSGGGVVSLQDSIAAVLRDATITSSEVIGREQLSYTAASRAASGGAQAFRKAMTQTIMNLRKSAVKRLELSLLYGQDGLGVVESRNSDNIVIKASDWSPMTFTGLNNSIMEFWEGATEHGAITGSTLNTVTYSTRTLGFATSGPSGGTAVDADDVLYFIGAFDGTNYGEMVGLMKIAGSSTTLFGINPATAGQSEWRGNTVTSFGAPTMARYLSALTNAVERGLEGKAFLLVPPKAFEVLNSDMAGQRMFDGSYSKSIASNGAQALRFYGQNGEIELRVHPYLRNGDSVFFDPECFKRIGSAELGMGVPGTADERQIYFHLESKNAVELRTYTDQALFCVAPNKNVKISGLTYP